ncbi:hypothetical protein HPB48_007045 [Haemaphysalis longicornis]|uniref:SUZ domain-containing protein n=1 Tax=Haemaphysalis longicornis TaxID=44386 RepID=A0A9J6FG14_HAELO|nr:hypothetical protein HPB48_007045 [Haemaphysalis longicornis]
MDTDLVEAMKKLNVNDNCFNSSSIRDIRCDAMDSDLQEQVENLTLNDSPSSQNRTTSPSADGGDRVCAMSRVPPEGIVGTRRKAAFKVLKRTADTVPPNGGHAEKSAQGPRLMNPLRRKAASAAEGSFWKEYQPAVKILKRPPEAAATANTTIPKSAGAEGWARGWHVKSLQQREQDYKAARLRILGSAHSQGEGQK